MQGYGQPQTGYTTPQVPNTQGGMQQDPFQGGTYPYNAGYPGQQVPSYNYAAQQGGGGSYIPQTPYSPGYTSPGYQPQNNGYPQQGGTAAVNGYPQQGGTAAMNGYPNAYAQPGGYTQGGYSQPGTYPQNAYPQGGYTQPGGYAQPGGTVQGGYAQPGVYQAYNPYGQMGRVQPQGQPQPDPASQIPLNGGGYIPQRVPVRRRGFEMKDWYLILAGAVLIALFAAAVLILKNTPLKIATILLATGSAAVLWVKPLTAENKRLTYTILALALCLLTILSFVIRPAKDATNNDALPAETAGTAGGSSAESGGVPAIPLSGGEQALLEEPTPTPENTDNQLMERLVAFFSYWSANRQDEMLTLCAPSWQSKQENPRTALFALIANRFPKDCTPESITGTEADTSRRVTVTTTIDRKNGKPEEKFRMTILMVKEGGDWYVDPQSLQTYESAETPDPNVTDTPAPTATPYVDANTTLYYNPKGGEYYHLDANCKIINAKYVPLQGTFTYSQLNDDPYSKLKPCNVCGAPLREE